MPNLNEKLKKLENLLEKYVKVMKEEVNHYDEKLKSEEVNEEQQTEFQNRKQELETKIEKVKNPYLAQLYLDDGKILEEEGGIKGKIAGAFGGIGAGAGGGAMAGAGLMALAAPYTFGLSLTFIPAAATIGAVAGGLGGGTTGLAIGAAVDKSSESEKARQREEIKGFLEHYKTMIADGNEVKEVENFIENNFNNVEKTEAYIENK